MIRRRLRSLRKSARDRRESTSGCVGKTSSLASESGYTTGVGADDDVTGLGNIEGARARVACPKCAMPGSTAEMPTRNVTDVAFCLYLADRALNLLAIGSAAPRGAGDHRYGH
jgi:hypothetical protein